MRSMKLESRFMGRTQNVRMTDCMEKWSIPSLGSETGGETVHGWRVAEDRT